jgi:hypothetical protein
MLREKQPAGTFLSLRGCWVYCQIEEAVRGLVLEMRLQKLERVVAEKGTLSDNLVASPVQSFLKKKRSTLYWTKVQYTGLPQFSSTVKDRLNNRGIAGARTRQKHQQSSMER